MFSYSASRAWPQLFPSHRRIPVQTKQNIVHEQMCFKNGRSTRSPVLSVCREGLLTVLAHGEWETGARRKNTRGIPKHMDEHTCTNTLAKMCRDMHSHSQISEFFMSKSLKRDDSKLKRCHVTGPEQPQIWRSGEICQYKVGQHKFELNLKSFEIKPVKLLHGHTCDGCLAYVTHSDT